MGRRVFPFAAVIGQESVKKALLLNAVNPRIGGVLIHGEKGTAKSTLVRGLADIMPDTEVIDLPLNITEDRLVGGIDIEAAIVRGKKAFEPGLLHRADGNILYVDEVNLLSEHIANCLLEAAASGENIVEREGISHRHASRFILVGTMNPEEGELRPQIVDRFGLSATVHGEPAVADRAEIIRRRLAYEADPAGYRRAWQADGNALRKRIAAARALLPEVVPSEANLTLAALVARQGGCAGHRAEITIIEAARTIAALDGRRTITDDDIREAAGYALPHRLRQAVPVPEEPEEVSPEPPPDGTAEHDNPSPDETGTPPEPSLSLDGTGTADPPPQPETGPGGPDRERVEDPAGGYDITLDDIRYADVHRPRGTGKRTRVRSGSRQGRYVRCRLPRGKVTDLAFDATLRAAAPFQRHRRSDGLAVSITAPDIREKVREKHTGCVVLFVVDASGSMGARRRMAAVKGAVQSLLTDTYRKRDRVGLIAFRDDRAAVLLDITRSIDLAHARLKDLPTGGRTPLASGLARACEILKTARIRETDMLPYLVLVSDGRANRSLNGGDPYEDALAMAARIRREGIPAMALDTETGLVRLGMVKKLAEVMHARYVKLDDINTATILNRVKQLVA